MDLLCVSLAFLRLVTFKSYISLELLEAHLATVVSFRTMTLDVAKI